MLSEQPTALIPSELYSHQLLTWSKLLLIINFIAVQMTLCVPFGIVNTNFTLRLQSLLSYLAQLLRWSLSLGKGA